MLPTVMAMVPSPTRPRLARRPTLDTNLVEVGLKLQNLFHLHLSPTTRKSYPPDDEDSDDEGEDGVVPDLDEDIMPTCAANRGGKEVNISSPLASHFPFPFHLHHHHQHPHHQTPGASTSSAGSTPHLTPSSSCESLLLHASSSYTEPIPDPYHVKAGWKDEYDEDMDELRASSARAALRLPPQPQPRPPSRSRPATRFSVKGKEKEKERRPVSGPIVDPWALSLLAWRPSYLPAAESTSTTTSPGPVILSSEKALRSVRSFVTAATATPTASSPSATAGSASTTFSTPTSSPPRSPIRKSLSLSEDAHHVALETARGASPPPLPVRKLMPRRASSASSLV